MSVSKRIFCSTLLYRSPFSARSYPLVRPLHLSLTHSFIVPLTIPRKQRGGGAKENRCVEKSKSSRPSTTMSTPGGFSNATEAVVDEINALSIAESKGQSSVSVSSIFGSSGLGNHGQKAIWKPKAYGTVSEATAVETDKATADQTTGSSGTQSESAGKPNAVLSQLFNGKLLENFTVDNSTYSIAQVRATFYPKFENEKSDQEVRTRMIEMVSKGLATLEVSLKHSGSLFMYAGHEGGAYAKNSYGNIYTAVGIFVLGRMFHEAWGSQASKKQAEFNEFLEVRLGHNKGATAETLRSSSMDLS